MLLSYKLGQESIIVRIKIQNANGTAGKTGLSDASSGLIISTIADNEASATVYTVAASNVETISTLGTYAAPTAGKCRFKEVDATNHKGIYELQFANARFAVSNSKSLIISLSGATDMMESDSVIQLTSINPYDATNLGLSALPAANPGAQNGLPIVDSSGRVAVNNVYGTVSELGAQAKTDVANAVWNEVIDSVRTAKQLLRGIVAILLGKSSGHVAGASTPKYRNIGDTKNVVDAVTDGVGNRTNITLDLD